MSFTSDYLKKKESLISNKQVFALPTSGNQLLERGNQLRSSSVSQPTQTSEDTQEKKTSFIPGKKSQTGGQAVMLPTVKQTKRTETTVPKVKQDFNLLKALTTPAKSGYFEGASFLPSSPQAFARDLGYHAERAGAGLLGAVESVTDFVGSSASGIAAELTSLGGQFNNPVSDWLRNQSESFLHTSPTQSWKSNINERYQPSIGTQRLGNITETVAQMLPALAVGNIVSASAPAIGAANAASKGANASKLFFGLQAAGSGAQQAASEGASTGQALTYGALSGLLETSIESLAGGIPGLGKGVLSDVAEKVASNPLVIRALDIVGEGGEEALSTIITPYIQRAVYNAGAENATADEIAESAVMGMVAAGILQVGIELPTAVSQVMDTRRTVGTNEDIANRVNQRLSQPGQVMSDFMNAGISLPAVQQQAPIQVNAPVNVQEKTVLTETARPAVERAEPPSVSSASPAQMQQEPIGNNTVGAKQSDYPYQQKNSRVGSNTFSKMYQDVLNEIEANGGNVSNLTYDVVSERQSLDNAQQRLFTDLEGEIKDLPSRDAWSGEDLDTAMGIMDRYMAEAMESGDYSKVNEWAKLIQSKGTRAGQMIQAFAKYSRTPQGVMVDAVNVLDNSRLSDQKKAEVLGNVQRQMASFEQIPEGDTQAMIELIKENSRIRRTGSLFSNKISGALDSALQGDSYEHLRDVALSQIDSIAKDYQPRSAAERLRAARQMFMLSNVTTVLRNIGGNQIFDPIDSLAGNTFVAPLDMLLSKYTGTRSVAAENPFSATKWKGALDNAMKSYIEVALDVNTKGVQNRYDQTSSRTFKMTGSPFERFLSTWAKYQGYALNTTDEFAKGGIQAETQSRLDALKDRGLIKDDTLDTKGQEEAKYRTFQDDTRLSRVMLQGRNALNNIGWDGFGAGDLLMPFARVPANLVTRSVEYSPLGLANGTAELIGVLQKARNGTLTAAEQAKAVSDIGRGMTGTGLIAAFGALAAAGLIRVAGNGEGDEDKTSLETSEGISGTQLNLSGALRWLRGEDNALEWRDGDQILSIGFLEPLNAQMTTGALLAQELDGTESLGEKAKQFLKSSFDGTLQSLMDLPAMSSLQDLANGYTYSDAETTGGRIADAFTSYGASQVSSFVPNFVRAIAKASDPYVRDIYSSGTTTGEMLDNIKLSIPGLRQTLPIKQTPFGEDRTYGDSRIMNALNALLLPGAVTEYRTSGAAQELYRLPTVEDNPVYPRRNAPNSVSADGTGYPLTAEQKTRYQKTYGQTYQSMIDQLMGQSAYQSASDEDKARMLNMAREYASEQAKTQLLSGQGVSYEPEGWIGGALRTGVPAAPYLLYRFTADADGNNTISQGESGAALLPIRDLSTQQKGAVWQSQNSTWSEEKNPFTGTLAKAGVSPETTTSILNKHAEINSSDLDARGKQTELSKFFDSLELTDAQRTAADDTFKFYTMIPAKVNPYSIDTMSEAAQARWDRAKAWGMDEETYLKFYPIYAASGSGLTKEVKLKQMEQAGMTRAQAEYFWDLMKG